MIYIAQQTGDRGVPDLDVCSTTPFPSGKNPDESKALHRIAAIELADALEASLPGGTLSHLEAELLQRRVNSLVVKRSEGKVITDEISAEAEKAEIKHGGFTTVHEVYGVLVEEVDEFFDEVRKQSHDAAAMRKELLQIAAVCVKAIKFLERKKNG